MIAALSLTLYLTCGMPERLIADDGAGWVRDFQVVPYSIGVGKDGKRKWGYRPKGQRWELVKEAEIRAKLGGIVTEKDTCK